MNPQVEEYQQATAGRGEAVNPFRRFCRLKGIKGKGKKKMRKAIAQRTSAKAALEREVHDQQTAGGLINAGQGEGHYRTPGR